MSTLGERGKAESVMKVGDRVSVRWSDAEPEEVATVAAFEGIETVVVRFDDGEKLCLGPSRVRLLSQGYAVGQREGDPR